MMLGDVGINLRRRDVGMARQHIAEWREVERRGSISPDEPGYHLVTYQRV
jgi:hypothetical protein